MLNWNERARAAGIHFAISIAIAVFAGLLVFVVWYPYPYREISGGRELFLLVVGVDVILGPLITLAIFNRAKPPITLCRDLVIVALIQLAALAYGLWTVAIARPVHLVFEVYRFNVVHAVEVPDHLLSKSPSDITALPLTGPTIIAVRPFTNQQENAEAMFAALQGVQLAVRPDLWQNYDAARAIVVKAAKPIAELKARFPSRVPEIDAALQSAGRAQGSTAWVPMVGRRAGWTAFVDSTTADVVAFMPLDSF